MSENLLGTGNDEESFTVTKEMIREAQGRGDLKRIPAHASLVAKLHPLNDLNLSPQMIAILGFLLDEAWTEPQIVSMSITSDGFLVTDGDFMGQASNLDKNLKMVVEVAKLNREETAILNHLRDIAVEDFRTIAVPREL